MNVRILTIPFDLELGRFDDEPAQRFLADKELLSVEQHFFVQLGQPHIALVVTYAATKAAKPRKDDVRQGKNTRRENWRQLLEPGDMPLFNTLREWRNARAKDEGVPPYVVCTNSQLARVVRARPLTLSKLAQIEGFGAAKIKSYGRDMLGVMNHEPSEAAAVENLETSPDGR